MNVMMIPTDKIYPHPLNPRTDLGDLTELIGSIKVMGILQNLTVVPYSPVDHPGITITSGDGSDCYVVVAGNRRLAAALRAKLKELPCQVSNMDILQQLRVMQVENLNRKDLTTYQEAKSTQMMLDMGETVENIAKATGFSKSKVERRAKLAVFDADKFAESEARNPTLKDYEELAKLPDADKRNELLGVIGTANFKEQLSQAKSAIKARDRRVEQLAVVDTFAKKVDQTNSDMVFVTTIQTNTAADSIVVPSDADVREYFYTVSTYSITIYRAKTDGELTAEADRKQLQAELRGRYDQLIENHKRAYELRMDFMEHLTANQARKGFPIIAPYLAEKMLKETHKSYCQLQIDQNATAKLLGVFADPKAGISEEELNHVANLAPERTLLVMAYMQIEKNNPKYVTQAWSNGLYQPIFTENADLNWIYDLLTELGYQMSDMEKQLQDGSHPLYYQKPTIVEAA